MSGELRRIASARRRMKVPREPLPDGITQEARVELTPEQRERFRGDLDDLMRETEQLLQRASPRDARQSATMRSGLRATIRHAHSTSAEIDGTLTSRAAVVGLAVDHFVREEPWAVMAAAGSLGVLLGWLLGRRR